MTTAISNELSCRSMTLADLPQVLAIEQVNYHFPWSETIFRDCFQRNYRNHVLLLDERIIGYVMVSIAADEAHLLNICIAPAYQGQGFGRALLRYLLTLLKSWDVQTVFLEVRPSNHMALNLYHALGFQRIGIRQDYYQSKQGEGREDAWVLSLVLQTTA